MIQLSMLAYTSILFIHFTLPYIYFQYAIRNWLNLPWNILINKQYLPTITVIIPTYNEELLIKKKLENILNQDYPREKLSIIVVDSSTDNTINKINEFIKETKFKVQVIRDTQRRGKIYAMMKGYKLAINSDIIIFTDADSTWKKDALKEASKYFSDKSIGVVTGNIYPEYLQKEASLTLEKVYREHTNMLRVSESKYYSTPIVHGPLVAFKKEALMKIGGVRVIPGADDSTLASLTVLSGYRCIQVPSIIIYEYVPRDFKSNLKRKARRAYHLVYHFAYLIKKILKYRAPKKFIKIVLIEAYIHLINPWLLLIPLILSLLSDLYTHFIPIASSILILSLLSKTLRTWIISQFVLLYAMIKVIIIRKPLYKWKPIKRDLS